MAADQAENQAAEAGFCPIPDPTRQFSVNVPEGSPYADPKALQPIVEKLREMGLKAAFKTAADGTPERDEYDGYIFITQDSKAATYAPQVLKQFGLTPFKN